MIPAPAPHKHTVAALVENRPGVLNRVASMFRRRGFNIDSLAVGTTEEEGVSRMTIVVEGPPEIGDQVRKQLDKLIDVITVEPLTEQEAITRELALIKVAGTGEKRVEALRLADVFRAKVVDSTTSSFIFEITGVPDKIDSFVGLMRELGLVEVGRTGIVGMMRGAEGV